ncbi:MAG: ASKHA domain-containing protein [Clostridia bacterium]|nr:ASKHA domain-containing protein [Clostridia bacterium]
MFEITFQFENGAPEVKFSAAPNTTVLDAARAANVAIDAPCNGNGSCGKCRVKLVEGSVESVPSRHITPEDYEAGWRLGCASKVVSDVTVMVPDIASAYQSRMKTADLSTGEEVAVFENLQAQIKNAGVEFSNRFVKLLVSMEEPSLDDTMPDTERFSWAVQEASGCEKVEPTFFTVKKLANTLREANLSVQAIGEQKDGVFTIYDVVPGDDTIPLCGCAIDIGTTTVTGVLMDLESGKLLAKASSGNGQIRYGADVINRIIEQSKPGGVKKLQDAIIKETLTPIIAAMCQSAKLPVTRILRMCIASNTTMNHLLLGVDAGPVRMEPYIPTFFRWEGLKAIDLALPANPNARVLLAPNIGSYVGGDITAGAFTTLIWDKDEFSLFIDIGTNAEIVFGNRDFMMSCACSAGPAFEGGDISCGMRATDGAIETVSIDRDSMEPSVKIIGEPGQKPVGICGSGIIDVIAELFRTSIISSKGKFCREGSRVAFDEHGMGRYVLARAAESATGREIAITEVDIESFIRAKGAIFSAVNTMLSSLDMDVSVLEHVYVAGGIGRRINMKNAVRIGMLPDIDRSLFEYLGNTSLAGAYAMALSENADEKVHELAANMTYLELSTNPRYMDEFVAACFLPHTDSSLFPSSVQE